MVVREIQRVAILGTLDTQGDGVRFIKGLIEARGHLAMVVDVGPLGPPLFLRALKKDLGSNRQLEGMDSHINAPCPEGTPACRQAGSNHGNCELVCLVCLVFLRFLRTRLRAETPLRRAGTNHESRTRYFLANAPCPEGTHEP